MSDFPLFDLKKIPSCPGVYIMRDAAVRIIYIGKANNLHKRLAFYLKGEDPGPKIQAMLSALRHLEYVECAGEREALLLEEKWIKQHQPLFNAMWKDDKTYPYVLLTMQEDFPRLYLARRKHIPPGALAFGPYPESGKVRFLIREFFRSGILPLRPCRWDFSLKNPLSQKIIHSCLYYHSGQCPAPCAGKISRARYHAIAKKAEYLFSGRNKRLIQALIRSMKEASTRLEFEQAGAIKNHIAALRHIGENVSVRAASREDFEPLYSPASALVKLKEALSLNRQPLHIEGFDISNISGTYPVGSMVCFVEGKPNKSHYRHFRIKTVEGINDFAMMEEVVRRRYAKLAESGEPMPDLVLIDGGLGQLSAAKKGLKSIRNPPQLCSLAKQKEILFLDAENGPKQVKLAKTHEGLKLCMWVRDEAHRFAITYHKKLRRKGLFDAEDKRR